MVHSFVLSEGQKQLKQFFANQAIPTAQISLLLIITATEKTDYRNSPERDSNPRPPVIVYKVLGYDRDDVILKYFDVDDF